MRSFKIWLWLVFFSIASFPAFLQSAELAVFPNHPRLFFRSADWGPRGLTLGMLRERAARPEAQPVLERLKGSLPNLALRALVLDDSAASREALQRLASPLDFKEITTDEGIDLGWAALAYDWLHGRPEFSDSARSLAAENIAAGARRLIEEMSASGPHLFHTRMYGWAMGIALAGLALYGEHPEAEGFVLFGRDYFREKLFPARRLQDGSVHNSFGYGRKYTMWLTAHFISCWYSATGENLWQPIANEQGDWARREILFLIYGRYPDGSYLRFGDGYSLNSDYYTFRAISERAWAYADPVGTGFLNLLIDEDKRDVVERPSAYIYFLFYDPEAQGVSHKSLPTKVLFSRNGTGMAIWKSSWEPDGTTIFFKCGNYFDDHGHFDQGHLDIYRRSPLLLDSGAYLTFDGPFRMQYWRKTVAHNSLLVVDPGVENDEGGQRIFHSQTDSTMSQYLADTLAETGEILDYREEPGLAYIAGDMTAAYPRDRVGRATRELAFLDDRYLIVVDRVRTTRPELIPKILWHCPVQPQIDQAGRRFVVSRNGARVIVRTLLPQAAGLEWVEGFRVGNLEIEPPRRNAGATPELGAGRVEVSRSSDKSLESLFVHVIDVADTTDAPGAVSAELAGGRLKVTAGERSIGFRAAGPGLAQ